MVWLKVHFYYLLLNFKVPIINEILETQTLAIVVPEIEIVPKFNDKCYLFLSGLALSTFKTQLKTHLFVLLECLVLSGYNQFK